MSRKKVQMLQVPFLAHYIRPSLIRHIKFEPSSTKGSRVQLFSERATDHATIHGFDPHSYTSGRWLRNDKYERQMRQINLDFNELCRKIVEISSRRQSIKNCEKIEGGFNRVFIFTMEDGSRLVARLPFSTIAGPAKLATASEVATIQYLQRNTSIPIPRILHWSDDPTNSVGSEYIIMEYAAGIPLQRKWPHMRGDQKVRCIDAIYKTLKEMANIDFPAYGSLYLSTAPLTSFSKIPLDSGDFCIGPHCGTRYWDCGDLRYYQHTIPNQGPWSALGAFADGLIDAGLSRIPPRDLPNQPLYHGSVQTHLDLLERGRTVLNVMSADTRIQDTATPTLFHPDLHMRNIFVSDDDPSVITAIIDWQSSSIEPAFWYADEVPDFATRAPSSTSSAQLVHDSELCAKAYDVCTQFLTPKLALPRLVDESFFRPFRYCYRTWKDGAVAFRQELIETSTDWETRLGFVGLCPFVLPAPEELALHQKEYRCFVAAQDLKRDLSSLLDSASDGWVPPEHWEAAKAAHRAMYEGMLQAVLTNQDPDDDEPIRDESDLRGIWPFDLPVQ